VKARSPTRKANPPDQVSRELRARGLRATPQRLAVYDALQRAGQAVGARELEPRLAHAGVGLSTIYRALELLVDLGMATPVLSRDGTFRYAPARRAHTHHLICDLCGRVEPFTRCDLGQLAGALERESGYLLTGHHLEFHGRCPSCAPS